LQYFPPRDWSPEKLPKSLNDSNLSVKLELLPSSPLLWYIQKQPSRIQGEELKREEV
ncbi:unnamed protein product, partial [Musa acuminata var. zebrina]